MPPQEDTQASSEVAESWLNTHAPRSAAAMIAHIYMAAQATRSIGPIRVIAPVEFPILKPIGSRVSIRFILRPVWHIGEKTTSGSWWARIIKFAVFLTLDGCSEARTGRNVMIYDGVRFQ